MFEICCGVFDGLLFWVFVVGVCWLVWCLGFVGLSMTCFGVVLRAFDLLWFSLASLLTMSAGWLCGGLRSVWFAVYDV